MNAPLCTVTPLEALRRLYDVARKVDAHESGDFDCLLQGELAVAEAALREAAAPVVPVAAQPAWKALSDVQWMNIVNHDHAYDQYSKEDAMHTAVKMTEAKCKELNAAPQPAASVTDVAKDAALATARKALNQAEYAIKGREHTGFITTAIYAIDAAIVAQQGEKNV